MTTTLSKTRLLYGGGSFVFWIDMDTKFTHEFERLFKLKQQQVMLNDQSSSGEYRFWCLALHLAKQTASEREAFLKTNPEADHLREKIKEILTYITKRVHLANSTS